MPQQVTKILYQSARKAYKDPIQLLHALYNVHCDIDKRIPSMGKFEGMMQMWLGNKGYKLLQGCLMIRKNFDKKFA